MLLRIAPFVFALLLLAVGVMGDAQAARIDARRTVVRVRMLPVGAARSLALYGWLVAKDREFHGDAGSATRRSRRCRSDHGGPELVPEEGRRALAGLWSQCSVVVSAGRPRRDWRLRGEFRARDLRRISTRSSARHGQPNRVLDRRA